MRLFFPVIAAAMLIPHRSHAQATNLFGITHSWRFNQVANLDGVDWKSTGYDDSSWPSGPGLLYSESNSSISPRNTPLTLGRTTYYFRSTFQFTGNTAGMVLTFSNRVDDGAVFYLNGQEIQRVRMAAPPTAINYATYATSTPSGGDATAWDVFTIPATNVVSGTNTMAVEVHQASANSSDIVFGSALSLGTASVSRGPYLQSGSSTNTIVRWRTDLPVDSVVWYGTNPEALTSQKSAAILTNEHEVNLTSLLPDTRYYYAIGSSEGVMAGSTNHFFVTAPVPGTPKATRIWVIGDAGTKNANQAAVRDAYYNFTGSRHTDLWLMLGDNAYDNGTDAEYEAAVFDMYPTLLQKSVVWPTLGNHDTAQSTAYNNNYPYFAMFTLPTNGEAGGVRSETEHYYSFDYGNIHFICLDSMTANRATNGAMADWLRSDIAATTNLWLIAFFHHPPYTKGSHNSDTETVLIQMRERFLPILEEGGVDVVLTGHSHSYERSMLLDSHYGLSTALSNSMVLNAGSGLGTAASGPYTKWTGPHSHQGAVYAVVGSSGKTSGGTLNHPAMEVSLNQLGSMVIDINNNRLTAKFIRENGQIVDAFDIVKQDVKIEPVNLQPAGLQLTVTNVAAGKTNVLQASTTLSHWQLIATNVIASNWFRITDANTNSASRFYRIQRLP